MSRVMAVAIVVATLQAASPAVRQQPPTTGAVFVAYYWHAKPGQVDAYNDYIRTVAVPIDEDARRAGAARGLGAALDAATARIVQDEAKRKANSDRAATLRDFVRQEMWTELK